MPSAEQQHSPGILAGLATDRGILHAVVELWHILPLLMQVSQQLASIITPSVLLEPVGHQQAPTEAIG